MHSVAQAYGVRPSGLLGIEDAWAALQFDTAVLGSVLSAEPVVGEAAAAVPRGDWRQIVE